MAKTITLTQDGLKKLEDELKLLKDTTRTEIAEKIKIARGFGDLSENSEYDEAKNEQAKVEARIAELEAMLKNVQLLDESTIDYGVVSIGTAVKVLDTEFDEEDEYKIVGTAESDPLNNIISDESPIGKALMGHKAGEEVVAEVPSGHITFKILDVKKA